MDNFDGLAIYDIVAVFSNLWVIRIPFFEVDVDVVVTYSLALSVGGIAGSFPSWEHELLWFHDNFRYFA